MYNKQKGSIALVIFILVLIVSVGGYFYITMNQPEETGQIVDELTPSETNENTLGTNAGVPVETVPVFEALPVVSEDKVLADLLKAWGTVSKTFKIKAAGGVYNAPLDVQFIAANKLLVHYDDGVSDHISLLQLNKGKFTELSTVATLKMFTNPEWQTFFAANGDPKYTVINYTTGIPQAEGYLTFDTPTRVDQNVMVR